MTRTPRALLTFGLGLAPTLALAQSLQLVTVNTAGVQADRASGLPAISPDGRCVAFASVATNLGPSAPLTNHEQVFLRDLALGTTTQLSVSPFGAVGNQRSRTGTVSTGGQFVTFWSDSTNLVVGDANLVEDAFVWDRQAGALTRASVNNLAQEGNGTTFWAPDITPDGRFVAFSSQATNLVPNDLNNLQDVFVRDRQTATTFRVNLGILGAQTNAHTAYPCKISDDGRFVAFLSYATNLVPNDTNGFADVFVHDRQTATTQRVSVGPFGIQGDNACLNDVAISGDGRYVAFQSQATNLVPNDTNGYYDLFVHDRVTGITTRENVSPSGAQVNWDTRYGIQLSFDGRFIAFTGSDCAGVPAGSNGYDDVYVRDRLTGLLRCASLSASGGVGDGASQNCGLSADGRYVVFDSTAHLVPGDTNNTSDVFLRDLGPPPTGTAYCFGDGTGTACPCAASGTAGRGCPNSSFPGGALLTGAGNAGVLLGPDTLSLTATNVSGTGLFFQGAGQTALGLGIAFGDGLLCLSGVLVRIAVATAPGGVAVYPSAATPVPIGIVGGPIPSGSTRYYQFWYRDAAVFCQPATYGLTQGLAVNWQ